MYNFTCSEFYLVNMIMVSNRKIDKNHAVFLKSFKTSFSLIQTICSIVDILLNSVQKMKIKSLYENVVTN